MTYKKRAKSGWNVGKSCKKESNRSERVYSKQEVNFELEMSQESYLYKSTSNKKKKPKLKDLKNKLEHKKKELAKFKKRSDNSGCEFWSSFMKNFINRIEEEVQDLEDLIKGFENVN